MSFFSRKKDKNVIPPVSNDYGNGYGNPGPRGGLPNNPSPRPGGGLGGYHPSNGNTYNASRDGDPYAAPRSRPALYTDNSASRAPQASQGYGDNTSRDARAELFAGYNPEKSGSGRFFDGPPRGRTPPPGEENEEDVEGIKQQTRYVKQESVQSSRNALRLAQEAEETARNTLGRLGDQSEKLADTERHLYSSEDHARTTSDQTKTLKKLNQSIFIPVITTKSSKSKASAAREAFYEEQREQREQIARDVGSSGQVLGRAGTYGSDDNGGRRFKTQDQLAARKEQRKRFQFEATGSDDELEDELDDNLDEISDMTKRLKSLGTAMGQELDNQNKRIDRIDEKTTGLDRKIVNNTERLRRIK